MTLDTMTSQTPAQSEANSVAAVVSWSAMNRAAVEHADQLAATNKYFANARDNPAAVFGATAELGFTMGIGAQARKAFSNKWKPECCQFKRNSITGTFEWLSTTWDTDVEVYESEQHEKVKYKAGDTRPQSLLPVAFKPYDSVIIVMKSEQFAIDLDWPSQLSFSPPVPPKNHDELLALLLTHSSFEAMWNNMIECDGRDSAMEWLKGQIVQKTRSNGYTLFGRKRQSNNLRQVTGALVRPYKGALPEGYDIAISGVPMCAMDTRCANDDGGAKGIVFGPGTVMAVDDKATNKAGNIVLVEQWYSILATGTGDINTAPYLPDASANFIMANVISQNGLGRPSHLKHAAEPSGLEHLDDEVPTYGIKQEGESSLSDGMNTPIIRDPQQVKEQLVHSINAFIAERRAVAAQDANAAQGVPVGEPIVRTAPQYEDYAVSMERVTWPIVGSVAFGEFGDDPDRAAEIGKSIYDTATQMFTAVGIETSNNEKLWNDEIVSAHARVKASGSLYICRVGRIEDDAKRSGWVAPAIAPSALVRQPGTNGAQDSPPTSISSTDRVGTLSAGGRKRRVMSTAAPKFMPATGTPNWAVYTHKKDPATKATVRVVTPCEATAAQAASYMGLSGRFNELENECEVDIPASTDLAGVEIGFSPLSDAVARAVAVAASIKHNAKFGPKIMDEALRTVCEERPYNPVANFLHGCKMVEGITCDQFFRKYANVIIGGGGPEAVCPKTGLTESQLADIQSELTLVALVGRALDSGGEFQQIPVLVSDGQGVGKSDAWKALTPNKMWHGDVPLFGLDAKKVAEATKGKWIHENPEMEGFNRTSSNALKGLISRTGDQARMAYDRNSSHNLRRWLMVCTSNIQYFLFDPSGDRRYWPWLVGKVDVDAIRRDRDALLAHAVHLFYTKYQGDADLVLLDAMFYDLTDMVREKFTIANPKEDELRQHATIGSSGNVPISGSVMQTPTMDYLWMPSTELYKIVLGRNAKLTNGGSGEVSDLLRRQGWEARKFSNARGWRRPLTQYEKTAHDALNAQTKAAQQLQGDGNVVSIIAPKAAQPTPAVPPVAPEAPSQTNPAGPNGSVTQ